MKSNEAYLRYGSVKSLVYLSRYYFIAPIISKRDGALVERNNREGTIAAVVANTCTNCR